MVRFLWNTRQLNLFLSGYFVVFCVLLLPCYNCCATDVKSSKHNAKANGLTHKFSSSSKGQDVTKLKKITSSLFAQAKKRANLLKKAYVDKNGQKRDNFVTIPEPYPVNKFEEQPYLDRRTNYVPQPYPVSHVEYVANPIAVPIEVPNQLRVQHFHVHKDCEYLVLYYTLEPIDKP